ncbi:MAG TPA: MFS transporter [Acidimicrobiia bacterium]
MRTEDTPRTTARQTGLAAVLRMFTSLQVPNFRLFFAGQVISLSGTWMQGVAQAWLVLDLTGSGTALGLVSSLQFLPVLLFGPMGGVLADRFDKRKVLYATQTAAAMLAAILGTVVATGVIEVWMVYVLAACLGLIQVVDNPTRMTFIHEMVGAENLTNAVSLNSVLVNVARVIGPGVAGALIVTVGLAPCFFINAVSYVAVLIALFLMNPSRLFRGERVARRRGQLREGFRYVRATPEVLVPLIMMAVIGTLAYEFQVSLPLLARFTFHGDAGTFARMSVLMGAGAIVGGLITAASKRTSATVLAWTAGLFGAIQLLTAVAPTLALTYAALVLLGATSIRVISLGNATLQLAASPAMRGRVMALWSVAFLGSTPIGGPIVGWVGEHIGPRVAIGMGGVASMACGLFAYRALARIRLRANGEEPTVEVQEREG